MMLSYSTIVVDSLKWPQRLPMASEITSNLKFELSDLNYLIHHCFLASNANISRISHGRISSVDLRPRTSSQVKITAGWLYSEPWLMQLEWLT